MNKMVCNIRYNGLGDALAFSTLPERCHEYGIDFYFHDISKSLYDLNPQVFDLIWKANPYFKGYSGDKINAGSIHKSQTTTKESIVYQFERLHGFSPKNKYPKIYVELEKLPELKDITIIDLNCFAISKEMWRNRELLVEKVDELISDEREVYYVQLRDKPDKITDRNAELLSRFKPLYIDSLLHYCHVLNSVKRFVTVLSGANTLASAIKQEEGLQIDTVIWHWLPGTYHFDNINYHVIQTV